jgi:hypothetical protein
MISGTIFEPWDVIVIELEFGSDIDLETDIGTIVPVQGT